MLQQEDPDDFVIATGEAHSVREFVEAGCNQLEMQIEWRGEGIDEVGIDTKSGKTIVKIDPRYFRPTEVELLLGDPSKAQEKLGWQSKMKFSELVATMVDADFTQQKREQYRFMSI